MAEQITLIPHGDEDRCDTCGNLLPARQRKRRSLTCPRCRSAAYRAAMSPQQKQADRNSKYKYAANLRSVPLSERLCPTRMKCRRCKVVKPIDEFGVALAVKTGRASRCKQCVNDVNREKYSGLEGKRLVMKRARDKYRATEHGQLAQLDYQFRRKYGITVRDYFAMLEKQGGLCALCLLPPLPKVRLAVDHDHTTGQVRGLLCAKCNSALERFDSIAGFRDRVVAYLELPPFVQLANEAQAVDAGGAIN